MHPCTVIAAGIHDKYSVVPSFRPPDQYHSMMFFFFFFTLVTGPRRSLSLQLGDIEPHYFAWEPHPRLPRGESGLGAPLPDQQRSNIHPRIEIAAGIYDKYSIGPFIRPICTRCWFAKTNMIQVAITFAQSTPPPPRSALLRVIQTPPILQCRQVLGR